jgi:hypothetical protein
MIFRHDGRQGECMLRIRARGGIRRSPHPSRLQSARAERRAARAGGPGPPGDLLPRKGLFSLDERTPCTSRLQSARAERRAERRNSDHPGGDLLPANGLFFWDERWYPSALLARAYGGISGPLRASGQAERRPKRLKELVCRRGVSPKPWALPRTARGTLREP